MADGSRRRTCRIAGGALEAGAVGVLVCVAAWSLGTPGLAAQEPGPLTAAAAAPGLYVHLGRDEDTDPHNRGDIANLGFIVGRDAVAVIDTGGSAEVGRSWRAAIRRVTGLPIRYVINTHVHADHVLGNVAFAADRPVYVGHAALTEAPARRGAYYREGLSRLVDRTAAEESVLVPPDLAVTGTVVLDLGDRPLTLRAYPTAHTDNDLTVFDHATRTLWLAALLFIGRIPVVDGSLKGWLRTLDSLAELSADRVVPGHGPVSSTWPAALTAQRRYLTVLVDEIRAVLAEGGTIERAMATVGRSEQGHWSLFDQYHQRNIAAAFVELEWE